ncbi:MAG: tetratricopeptide repeat protein [Acidobacteriota bacterium]|mgnify:FL=1|jgi:tetratricopeptide (TPR) repeat protein
MKRQWSLLGTLVAACVALLVSAAPAHAQLGSLQGRVVDEQGQPVPDATVTLEYSGELTYKFEVKTDAEGRWTRAGLMAVGGRWTITATKDGKAGYASNVEVPLNSAATVPDIVIREGGATSAEDELRRAREAAAIKDLLSEAEKALAANDYELGASKLEEAVGKLPTCDACYVQLGDVYQRLKRSEDAETAYQKAVEINPKNAQAYDGLAALYNTMGRLDQAAEAAARAMELQGGQATDATSAYNMGAIMMNAGKVTEARAHFQRAIELDPNMAEAHFQLGMTYINEGNVGEAIKALEQYLSLAPDGPNAQMAKDMLPELRKMQ